MSPLLLVGILVITSASADVKHVLEGSAHPPDPNSINRLSTPYWWMDADSPLKAAYDYYKKCAAKNNCVSPVDPAAPAPQPFIPSVPAPAEVTINVKKNPFLNGAFNPQAGTASYNEKGPKIDIKKNPFLSGSVLTAGNGAPVVKDQNGFLGVQPAQPFGKKPGFATTHPLEQKKIPGFATTHPLEQQKKERGNEGNLGGLNFLNVTVECKGAGFACVEKKQCLNGVVNTNGEGLLQVRSDVRYCHEQTEVCCQMNNLNEITAGKTSTIKFAGGAGFSPGLIHVQPLDVKPEIVFGAEHGHHSSSTSKSIRDTSLSPNSVFSSTVDYSDTQFDSDVRFASTFQGPAYLPPIGPTTPAPRPFETKQPSINQQYVPSRPSTQQYIPPSPTTQRPSTPKYIPPSPTTQRPAISTTYRPAPSTTFRPAPSTTFRPVPPVTFRPAPSTFKPAPTTSREYLPPRPTTPRPSYTNTQYVPPYQPSVTPQKPYQPSVTPQKPYQPSFTTQRPYQPSVTPQKPYQPSVTPQKPYQPSITPQKPYQPSVTTQRPYQPSVTPQQPYQPSITPQKPYQPSFTTQRPYQPSVTPQRPYQPSVTPQKPYQPSITPQKPYQPSVTTQQPYRPAITTQRPYQPSITPQQPYQPSVTPQRPYQPSVTPQRPYQPSVTPQRPFQPSVTPQKPYQPSTLRPYQPSYQPTTSRPTTSREYLPPRTSAPFVPQPSSPRPNPFLTQQTTPRPTHRPQTRPTPSYKYPSPSAPSTFPQPRPTPGPSYSPSTFPQPRPTPGPAYSQPTFPQSRPTPGPAYSQPTFPQPKPTPRPQPSGPTPGYQYPTPGPQTRPTPPPFRPTPSIPQFPSPSYPQPKPTPRPQFPSPSSPQPRPSIPQFPSPSSPQPRPTPPPVNTGYHYPTPNPPFPSPSPQPRPTPRPQFPTPSPPQSRPSFPQFPSPSPPQSKPSFPKFPTPSPPQSRPTPRPQFPSPISPQPRPSIPQFPSPTPRPQFPSPSPPQPRPSFPQFPAPSPPQSRPTPRPQFPSPSPPQPRPSIPQFPSPSSPQPRPTRPPVTNGGYQYPTPQPSFPSPSPQFPSPRPSIPQFPSSSSLQPRPTPSESTPGYQHPTSSSPRPNPFIPQQPTPSRPVTSPPFTPSTNYIQPSTPSRPAQTLRPYQPSTPKPFVPPQPTPAPNPAGGYEYPKPTPTFGYPSTSRPVFGNSNVNNQYIPPPKKTNENPDQSFEAANVDGAFVRPTSPRTPPFQGELNTAPPPGCAAALKCVQEIYCTAEGVVSPVPVVLTKEQELSRVPTTVCQDTESGIIGKCCRDPNYKDPWPSANLVDGVDDGQYKEDDSIGQYQLDLQRPVRSDKGGPRQDLSGTRNTNFQAVNQPTCGERHVNTNPPGVGPLDVNFAEIPWQAMVLRDSNRSLLCGGVIIRRDAVLTAAHCVEGLETGDILVKGGEWKLGIDEEPLPFQIVNVAVVVRHPQYQKGSFVNDLALLILEEKLRPAKNVGTLCLPQPNQIPTQNCIATGWGKRILQLHAKGAIMHAIDVKIMDNQQCQETLSNKFQHASSNYSPNTLCGYSEIDQCKVDYGSALACSDGNQYTLSGIYAWDTGCKQPGQQIGGYIAPDVDWIESTLARPIRELKKLEQN